MNPRPMTDREFEELYGEKGESTDVDMVNSPPHYNAGGIECIDAIKIVLGDEGFRSYCVGNALKYSWRANYKGKRDEDLKKAIWYLRAAVGDDPRKES